MSEVNSLDPRVQKSAGNGVAVGILVYAQVHQYPLARGHYAQVGHGDGHIYLEDLISRRVEAPVSRSTHTRRSVTGSPLGPLRMRPFRRSGNSQN